jgi:hypothetical protein
VEVIRRCDLFLISSLLRGGDPENCQPSCTRHDTFRIARQPISTRHVTFDSPPRFPASYVCTSQHSRCQSPRGPTLYSSRSPVRTTSHPVTSVRRNIVGASPPRGPTLYSLRSPVHHASQPVTYVRHNIVGASPPRGPTLFTLRSTVRSLHVQLRMYVAT